MATFTGKKSIFDAALGEYKDLGFSLEEIEEGTTHLFFKDKLIATYYQPKLTIPVLHEGCKNYLLSIIREARNGA